MKGKILLLAMLTLVAAICFVPAMAQGVCPSIEISKETYCATGVGYSDNPPYYVGVKYFWWIKITVHAYQDFSSVIVYDRLGAELMIEGICKYSPKYDPYDYDFTYTPYERNGAVDVDGYSGTLNAAGIAFDEFTIFWTGNSIKAHFMWNIGPMSAGETRVIYLVISTDTNPAGHQEYTSCGCYYLNSGATVKAIDAYTGRQYSAESNAIPIYIECPPC